MFKNDLTIYKVNTSSSFVNVNASAFTIGEGKVVMNFRSYNKNGTEGNKIQKSIDFYLSMDDFALFSYQMKNQDYIKEIHAKKNEIERRCRASAKKRGNITETQIQAKIKELFDKEYITTFKRLGGFIKDGKCTSRCFSVEKGQNFEKYPIILRATQGAGEKNAQGLYVPKYKFNEAEAIINIPLNIDDMIKLGLAGERAIRIFDNWQANNVLEKRVETLANAYKSTNGNISNFNDYKEKSKPQQPQQSII